MIRLSQKNDREGLIALWQEAFGDTREAVELFIDKRYLPQNTLVDDDNGKITSMLYLLDGKVIADGVLMSAYYLYAAATLKKYRGKGIMAKMLQKAKELAESRGVDLICLKPAEESLYDFYKKHGYKTVFSTKKAVIRCSSVSNNDIGTDKTDLLTARENAFENYNRFIWDKAAIEFAIEQHKYYCGKFFECCNGYCLYTVDGDVCSVKELCFTAFRPPDILDKISSIEQISEFRIDLPLNYPVSADEYTVTNNGMALILSQKAQFIENKNDLYLNLTLD